MKFTASFFAISATLALSAYAAQVVLDAGDSQFITVVLSSGTAAVASSATPASNISSEVPIFQNIAPSAVETALSSATAVHSVYTAIPSIYTATASTATAAASTATAAPSIAVSASESAVASTDSATAVTSSAPAAPSEVLPPIEIGALHMCVDADFLGKCARMPLYQWGECTNVPVDFNDQISSINSTEATVCTLYKDVDCTGTFIEMLPRGYLNLQNQDFNDVMSSYSCQEKCPVA